MASLFFNEKTISYYHGLSEITSNSNLVLIGRRVPSWGSWKINLHNRRLKNQITDLQAVLNNVLDRYHDLPADLRTFRWEDAGVEELKVIMDQLCNLHKVLIEITERLDRARWKLTSNLRRGEPLGIIAEQMVYEMQRHNDITEFILELVKEFREGVFESFGFEAA